MQAKSEKRKTQNKNSKLKNIYKIILFTFFIIISHLSFLISHFSQASAATMQDNNYILEKQTVEVKPFTQPTPAPKEPEKPFASGKNYTVEATNYPLTFSISDDVINFGELSATNPVIRLLNLTTTTKAAYQILATENHPLSQGDKVIPDTTCDNGSCTEETASIWTSNLTYGLGYQTQNLAANNFKQFPDFSKKEQFETIFGDKIYYKVNIANTQQEGTYRNVVTYLAVPSF